MKNLLLSFLILLTSFSVKAQNSNLPYSEKDYLITMNKVVNTISDLSNSYGEDTSVIQRLMDLSNNEVYALTFFNGLKLDGDTISSYVIKEWFIPTINSMSIYSPTRVRVIEKDSITSQKQIPKTIWRRFLKFAILILMERST